MPELHSDVIIVPISAESVKQKLDRADLGHRSLRYSNNPTELIRLKWRSLI